MLLAPDRSRAQPVWGCRGPLHGPAPGAARVSPTRTKSASTIATWTLSGSTRLNAPCPTGCPAPGATSGPGGPWGCPPGTRRRPSRPSAAPVWTPETRPVPASVPGPQLAAGTREVPRNPQRGGRPGPRGPCQGWSEQVGLRAEPRPPGGPPAPLCFGPWDHPSSRIILASAARTGPGWADTHPRGSLGITARPSRPSSPPGQQGPSCTHSFACGSGSVQEVGERWGRGFSGGSCPLCGRSALRPGFRVREMDVGASERGAGAAAASSLSRTWTRSLLV